MSAFFIAINRNREPFDKSIAESMMFQLDRFGGDSHKLIVGDYFAIGFQTVWRVPEELDEEQPLVSGTSWFGFYGRIDNRQQLLHRVLEHSTSSDSSELTISDAQLAERYFQQYGLTGLSDIIGPYSLFCFDEITGDLVLARDGMGARHLVFRESEQHILAGSYEMALVAHPSLDYKLNDESVALHLVSQMQIRPNSIIDGLDIIHPGHVLTLNSFDYQTSGRAKRQHRFYRPDPCRRVTYKTDQEYADEFRRLLDQAVSRRLRTIANVGTQLSGGMDSIPVTILAAQKLHSLQKGEANTKLSAYSWVFDEYPEADERVYSNPLCKKLGIEQVMVNCDDLWLDYDENAKFDPLGPIYNPFMAYNNELFKQAETHTVKVMLNGIHGDILYGYTQGILYELLKTGDLRALLTEVRSLLTSSSSVKSFFKDFVLKPLPFVSGLLKRRTQRRGLLEQALQPRIVGQLDTRRSSVDYLEQESRRALRPQQWQVVLGDFAGRDASTGRFLESEYAIERRYPFRDRELCEFMLAIPSKQLAFNNVKRPIVKRAFSADFSAELLRRNTKAYFADVTLNGVRNDKFNVTWANAGSREWSYYVKECYFDGKVEQNHLLDVVKWRCGYYDYWKSVCYHPMAKQLGLSNETSE